MPEIIITKKYLEDNPTHIFVFGDNTIGIGYGGAAALRDEPHAFGFVTKILPSNADEAFYKPDTYKTKFAEEIHNLIFYIKHNPNRTFLVSKLGAGLANKYGIWEEVILPWFTDTFNRVKYPNVVLLWELEVK